MSGPPSDPPWAAGYLLLKEAVLAGVVTTEEEVADLAAMLRLGLVEHTHGLGPAPRTVAAVEEDILGATAPAELWTP